MLYARFNVCGTFFDVDHVAAYENTDGDIVFVLRTSLVSNIIKGYSFDIEVSSGECFDILSDAFKEYSELEPGVRGIVPLSDKLIAKIKKYDSAFQQLLSDRIKNGY